MRCASPCGRIMMSPADQRHGAVFLFEASIAPSFEDQMKDDDVLGLRRQVRRHGLGVWFSSTPGRGKFTVEEDRAVEFHGLQHFRQHIHDISLGESGRSAKNSGRSDKRLQLSILRIREPDALIRLGTASVL